MELHTEVEIRGAWKKLDMTTHFPPYYIPSYIEWMGIEPKIEISHLQNSDSICFCFCWNKLAIFVNSYGHKMGINVIV